MDASWLRRRFRNTPSTNIKAWSTPRLRPNPHDSFHEDNDDLIVTDRTLRNDLLPVSSIQTLSEQYQEDQNSEFLSKNYQDQSQANCFTHFELLPGNLDSGLNIENFRQTIIEPLNGHHCRDQSGLHPPMQAYFNHINPIVTGEQLQTSFLDEKWGVDQRYGINSNNTGQMNSDNIIPADRQLSGMKYLDIQNNQEISSHSTWQGCIADDAGFYSHDCNMMYCASVPPINCQNYGNQSCYGRFPGTKWPSQSNFSEKNSPGVSVPVLTSTPLNPKSSQENSMWSDYRIPSCAEEEILESMPILPRIEGQSWRQEIPDLKATPFQHNTTPVAGFEFSPISNVSLPRISPSCHTDDVPHPHAVNSISDKRGSFYNTEPSPYASSPPEINPFYEDMHNKGQKSYATARLSAKDEFLIQKKQAGMSYKDIKRQGGYTEAESTLRGRFRTLTKAKSARVRKPEWTDNDNRLLKQAVNQLAPKGNRSKIPWKKVAEFIVENGGSYHFGNSTCRKRWDELHDTAKVPVVSQE